MKYGNVCAHCVEYVLPSGKGRWGKHGRCRLGIMAYVSPGVWSKQVPLKTPACAEYCGVREDKKGWKLMRMQPVAEMVNEMRELAGGGR